MKNGPAGDITINLDSATQQSTHPRQSHGRFWPLRLFGADKGGSTGADKHPVSVMNNEGLVVTEAASTMQQDPSRAHMHSIMYKSTVNGVPLVPPMGSTTMVGPKHAAAAPEVPGHAPPAKSWFNRSWARVKESLESYRVNLAKHPGLMLIPPIVLLVVCIALGVYGVIAGAQKEVEDKRTLVYGAGLDWAASFKLTLEQTFTPLITLSIFIKQDTDYTRFKDKFPNIAKELLATLPPNTVQELQVSPMGNISAIYPMTPKALTRLYADIFVQPELRGGALATVRSKQLMLNGPLYLINGGNFGAIVRFPIFISNSSLNDTFGTGKQLPTDCFELCWDPVTRTKFWGFVTAILNLEDLRRGNDTRLDVLKQKGYNYRMTRPYTNTEANPLGENEYVFTNSSSLPEDPVSVPVQISNALWTLYLEPQGGWQPGWRTGMIILVVLGSCVLAFLVAVIMASWAQQRRLLGDVLQSNSRLAATTQHLEEEKLRLDALLVRQYNLLSVLGGHSGKLETKDGSTGSGALDSKEGLTLERIEKMRQQLAVNSNSSAADIESIQTIELLGEGTFGKVFKGLWRGTVVAVKTMMLPANMSGAEKREKMAVMEAAISSSLSHPNIVQTYTYAIRPIRDQSSLPSEQVDTSALQGVLVRSSLTGTDQVNLSTRGTARDARDTSSSAANVHSYEVRLVLEYCDKGSLRDALDEGVFMTAEQGLNYCAILDVAADVAKAMLHLHSLNILHADLKARNVMLKSDGQGGTVIAKVADFGLSLKMDHMETHVSSVFQGTMTHMAPEILLDGRVSKAADVYAFGVTMWELFTGGHAFQGVPRALLGHQISRECLRPRFPDATPQEFKELTELCWHQLVDMRPSFEHVLTRLTRIRQSFTQDTPPLKFMSKSSRTSFGDDVLPPAAGVSARAPKPGSGTDEWGQGMTATVVRQRPVVLPKIKEGPDELHELDEEDDPSSGDCSGGSPPRGTVLDTPIATPSAGTATLTTTTATPSGATATTAAPATPAAVPSPPAASDVSIPSGMQVQDASWVTHHSQSRV